MLADDSALCSSKAIILEKLNGLAAQVLAEIKNMNTTDTSKFDSSTDAYKVTIRAQPLSRQGITHTFFCYSDNNVAYLWAWMRRFSAGVD